MPHFKKETFSSSNKAGTRLDLAIDILISADGVFYANLPDYLLDAFSAQHTPATGRKGPVGTFKVSATTYEQLKRLIQDGLIRYLTPEITETR